METGRVVEGSFGSQVRKDGGVTAAGEPAVGVRAGDSGLGVAVRPARRGRRLGGGLHRRVGQARHGGHHTAGALLVALGLVLASALPGLALAGPATAKNKVVFSVAMLGEGVDSLNPFLGIQAPSYEMWGLTYDYLTGYSMTDMSSEPGLATRWTTSDDGLTWTFTVQKGVTFSDGQPMTAADVAYTYERILHGEVEGASWISYLKGVTSVTAPDDTTVVMKLKKPSA